MEAAILFDSTIHREDRYIGTLVLVICTLALSFINSIGHTLSQVLV